MSELLVQLVSQSGKEGEFKSLPAFTRKSPEIITDPAPGRPAFDGFADGKAKIAKHARQGLREFADRYRSSTQLHSEIVENRPCRVPDHLRVEGIGGFTNQLHRDLFG
jgi:hypothetical protein